MRDVGRRRHQRLIDAHRRVEDGLRVPVRSVVRRLLDLAGAFRLLGDHFTSHAYRQVAAAVEQDSRPRCPDAVPAPVVAVVEALVACDGRRSPLMDRLRSSATLSALMALGGSVVIGPAMARRPDDAGRRPATPAGARRLLDLVRRACGGGVDVVVEPCGQYRRRASRCDFLYVVISYPTLSTEDDWAAVLRAIVEALPVTVVVVLAETDREVDLLVAYDERRRPVHRLRMRLCLWDHRAIAMLNATGSDEFVRRVRWAARDAGFFLLDTDEVVRRPRHDSDAPDVVDARLLPTERAVFDLIGMHDAPAPRYRDAFPLQGAGATGAPLMRSGSFTPFYRVKRAAVKVTL
ncbi:unnamed protein product (mitochondrion) [Plasmodiophora brassicae]|uniref:Uncharacterized protein n=1 Tax=Plasmodiophora brassicae TaxID=37360 RepID=A0A3P3YNM6_PLABS|nr:unnamed protein product [Plasmodiophora brassicae]